LVQAPVDFWGEKWWNKVKYMPNFESPYEEGGAAAEAMPQPPVQETVLPESKETEPAWADEVREYARNFFDALYAGRKEIDRFEHFFQTQDELSVIAECEKEWVEEKRYTQNFRRATKIFLEELIDFTQSKNDENSAMIGRFLGNIHETFFSSSPNIATALNLGEYFDFAARATRNENIQTYLGGNINGEFAGNIGWGDCFDSEKDPLFESYSNSLVSEKLDKLNLLELIHAEIIGAGNAYNYRGGQTKIDKLLSKISASNDNAFIGYYIDIAKKRFAKEYQNPSKGIFHWENDSGDARLPEKLVRKQWEKSNKLKMMFAPNSQLEREQKLMQVSKSTIAVLNHANLPVKYAQVDFNSGQKQEAQFISFDESVPAGNEGKNRKRIRGKT